MRIARTALGIGLAVGALLGGAATASAQPVTANYFTITAWHDVNVRQCASTACAIDTAYPKIRAGETWIAYCWRHGEPVTDAGITNDIWVKTTQEDGGQRYVSAVYLVGDERGNLPVDAVCTF